MKAETLGKAQMMMDYIDYADSQIESGLMPSTFVVWVAHEIDNNSEGK